MADLLVSKVNKTDARSLVPSADDHYLQMEPGGYHSKDGDDFCLTFLGFLKSGAIPPYLVAEPAWGRRGA